MIWECESDSPMASEDQPTVSMVTDDSPQQLSQIMKQDAPTRLIAVLTTIENASANDDYSDVRISRSDFKLIRTLADICARQARVRGVLDQLIHEEDQQLQSTRCQLDASQRTTTRLKRRQQTTDDARTAASDTATSVVASAREPATAASQETLPTSFEPSSNRPSLPRSDLEGTLRSDETVQLRCRSEFDHIRKTTQTEQSNSGFNVKSELAKDREDERESADRAVLKPAGAPCHVTLTREYTDKVVQQNTRLKKILRDLITQRHGSVTEFLVRTGPYHKLHWNCLWQNVCYLCMKYE